MKYTIQKIDESVPGIAVTDKAQDESKKGNDKYYSEVQKKMKDYEKPLNPKEDNIEEPKYEFTGEAEEYHRLGEIMNGLEMFRYDNEPSEQFKERARMAIEGDAKMGNAQTDEPVFGASDKDFGKKLVKSIEKKVDKENDAVTTFTQFGDDIELVPGKESKLKSKKVAIGEDVIPQKPIVKQQDNPKSGEQRKYIQDPNQKPVHPPKIRQQDNPVSESEVDPNNTHFLVEKSSGKIVFAWDYKGVDPEDIKEYVKIDVKDMFSDRKPSEFKLATKTGLQKQGIDPMDSSNWVTSTNEENNKQVTESKMKRLKFKQPFNGIETALKVIPESYKEDKKVFAMTDGNENYKIRWEGDATKGRPIVLEAYDSTLVKEDVDKIFHLMGYNPTSKHGTLKGKQRIEENTKFFDMMKKVISDSKPKEEVLTESEEKVVATK